MMTMSEVIPAEAVEAAAKALRKKFNGYEVERPWDSRDQRTTYHNDAIAALEAAAPYMLAAAWDEGYDGAIDAYDGRNVSNPYRKPADA